MSEQLVLASAVWAGRSACADHAMAENLQQVPTAPGRRVNECKRCLRVQHRAYYIVDQLPLCKRRMGPVASPNGLVVGHFTDPEGNLVGVAGVG